MCTYLASFEKKGISYIYQYPGFITAFTKASHRKVSRTCWAHSTLWKPISCHQFYYWPPYTSMKQKIFYQNLECIVSYVRSVCPPMLYVFSHSSRLDLVNIVLTNGDVHRIILSVSLYFLSLRINEPREQFVLTLHQSMFTPSFDRTFCRLVGRFVDT